MNKLIISNYISNKTIQIFNDADCVNDYGFNKEDELCVITEDMLALQELVKTIEETINAYNFDEAVKCDSCYNIIMIEDSKIIDGENICNDCNNQNLKNEYIDDPEYYNENEELNFIQNLD